MGLMDILNGMQNGPRGGESQQAPSSSGGGMPTWMMALLGLLAYKAIKGGGLENMMGGGNRGGAPDPRASEGPGGGLGDILGNVLGGGRAGAPGGGLGDILGGVLGGGRAGAPGGGGLGDILGSVLGGGRPGPQGGRPSDTVRMGAASEDLGNLLGGLLGGGAAGSVLNGGLRNLVENMEQNGLGEAAQSWVGRGQNRSIDPNDLAQAVGLDDIDAVARQTGMPREQLLSELSQHLPNFIDQLTPDGRLPTDEEAQSRWV